MRKTVFILSWIFIFTASYISSYIYMEPLAHIKPDYPMTDISRLCGNAYGGYTDDEYRLLYEQTGLGRAGVDSVADKSLLLGFQKNFFADVSYECRPATPVSFGERTKGEGILMAPLEDGDVLLTNCSHVLTWRNGHAGIVTNAERGETLEAASIGQNSGFRSVSRWTKYPSFAVLRLKDGSKAERDEIARTAVQNLDGKPYKTGVGIFPMKYSEISKVKGTQCAHLVWIAYAAHGYDTDSNKGLIVLPSDILKSGLFEVVQIYGMRLI